jgi:DNA-binding transcriptional MerR regulator
MRRTTEGDLLKIGEFARLADTNLRTVRYYEELGLLQPALRSAGGFRYYRRSDLARFETVRRLRHLGLSLAKIRDLLHLPVRDAPDRRHMLDGVVRSLEEQKTILRSRLGEIEGQLRVLDRSIEFVHDCYDCPYLPPLGQPYCDPCRRDGQSLDGPLRSLL